MIKFSRFTLAAALVLGLATAALAHNNNNNGCGNGGNGGYGGNHGGYGGNGGNHGGNGGNGWCQPTLRCDAGGPYTVDWAPGSVTVQLDGLDSTGAVEFLWSTSYPGAEFNDPTLPNPTLLIPVGNGCSFNVNLTLLVKRPGQTKSCCTTIRIRDRIKPVITCPELAKIISGQSTSPQALGFATATDNCDTNVHISYCDRIIQPACKADRFAYVIERTWRAVDNDCNVAKCVQIIDVVRYAANLDILPGACPNLYDRNASNTLKVAIAGTPEFDVTKIQWNSVRLWGFECTGGPLQPLCMNYSDVATPFLNSLNCFCTNATGDGRLDLHMQFSRSQINNSFGLGAATAGEQLTVVVTGKLCDGTLFIAQDCMTTN